MPSVCKTMGTVLWDGEGCILVESLPRGENVGTVHYQQMLQKLCCVLSDKCP